MKPTRKLITFDWAIKRLLRSKANFGILEGFLSELLKEDMTILEVMESEGNKTHAGGKFNRVDLKVYFLKNEEIKESFTAKGLKEAEEKLSIMKLPEDERQAYEHYKEDLHYQASMFESSFGDGYLEGKSEGITQGMNEAKKQIALSLYQAVVATELIAQATGLSEAEVQ